MYSKKKCIIRKPIINTDEIKNNIEQIENQVIKQEENNPNIDQLIIREEQDESVNYENYEKEANMNEDIDNKINQNNQNKEANAKKQIYKKVRSDSYRSLNKNVKINKYGNREKMPINTNNNFDTDFMRYNTNSKYSIKNPAKEKSKSKNRFSKNNSNILPSFYTNRYINSNKNLRLKKNDINNTDIYDNYNNYIDINNTNEEEIKDNTNYYFRPRNNLSNNIEYSNISNTDIFNNGGNINLNQKKRQYITLNKKQNNLYKKDFYYEPTPRERVNYIYDYNKENNKDSLYVESPIFSNNIAEFPLKTKKAKKSKADFITFNTKSRHSNDEKLRKKIVDSWRDFEKIREIEKKIKNYFNMNGLNIENRELYDQSATMIQSAFRAYYSRIKLYRELNLFVNIRLAIDILKKIILPRKSNYWECFLKGILNYLTFITTMNNENYINDNNNINNEDNNDNNYNMNNNINIDNNNINYYINPNNIFDNSPNNNEEFYIPQKNFKKKIPYSYRKKIGIIKNKDFNQLSSQLSISFTIINNKDDNTNKSIELNNNKIMEEKLNKIMLENDELKKNYENIKSEYEKILNQQNNNNIIKNININESVELRMGDENNVSLVNNNGNHENKDSLKISKLKYLIKNKILNSKELLHKYYLIFYYNSIILKNKEKTPTIYTKNKIKSIQTINNSNEYSYRDNTEEKFNIKKLKILKNLLLNKEKKIKYIIQKKFTAYYYKGLISEIKNNNERLELKENNDDDNININNDNENNNFDIDVINKNKIEDTNINNDNNNNSNNNNDNGNEF